MSLTFVSIADDDTGASDIAGMLAGAGMKTIMVLNSASPAELRNWADDADALVFATASRALPPKLAYARTREALDLVRPLRPRVIGIKYCSTFDSTPQGNIGPSIDAAMDALGIAFTIAVPALPVNGRTTYMGYHFVGQQLLSDSSMRHHPLNPMTNANLVSHLQSQTRRRVGLAAYPAVGGGARCLAGELRQLRSRGIEIAIVDCISSDDLEVIAAAVADMPLITGSSGPAITLPAEWKRLGYWSERPAGSASIYRPPSAGGTLLVSGSCSQASRGQIAEFESSGHCSIAINGVQLLAGSLDCESIARTAIASLARGEHVLLHMMNSEADIEAVHNWARSSGRDAAAVGLNISQALAGIVTRILSHGTPQGLVIAGGETSSAICRALGIKALIIGPNIVPGVPLCASMTAPRIPLVLKSGNFGGPDFFCRAVNLIAALPSEAESERSL